jgi:hypothetical protein
MKAAMIPINGTCFSPSDLFVRETAIPIITTVIAQQTSDTTMFKNPSGICRGAGE